MSSPAGQFGRQRQSDVYLAGLRGRRAAVPFDLAKLETSARRRMTRQAYAYVAGGAGLESTIAANRAAFDRRRIVPRMLRDVSVRDTSVELFGRRRSCSLRSACSSSSTPRPTSRSPAPLPASACR